LLVLLPLVVGLFIRARYADHAKAWQPELVKVAAKLGRAGHGHRGELEHDRVNVRGVGDRRRDHYRHRAGVLGVLLGGRSAEVRTTTGLVSVFHFASLGLIIIGSQLHGNPTYLGPAITFALIH
jgi:hypothetical protein